MLDGEVADPPQQVRVPDEVLARLFARRPERMVPDLDRIRLLSELMGRPDQAYPSFQITGTNGKGSVATMVTALLGSLGLSAGTYTSPHLQSVTERIRIAGRPLGTDAFVGALEEIERYVAEVEARVGQQVTFFELLTGLAFSVFADAPVDVGVFEVGMGGSWDATNLVRGEVGVIGAVTVDHPELGSTPEQAATEKAGIIKPGAAVVSGPQIHSVADIVAQRVREADARLVTYEDDFAVGARELAVGGQHLTLHGVTGDVTDVYLPLHGRHQAENAAVALAAVEGFLGFAGGLDPEVIREGFAAVRTPGRLEVVRRADAAPVILDGAHNPAGARALADALGDEFAVRHRVGVLAMLSDKDIDAVVATLAPLVDHLIVSPVDTPRSADPQRLADAARTQGVSAEVATDLQAALESASGVATPADAVVVTGSLYAVGRARDLLGLPVV